jgi:hypothetical protein
MSWLVENINFLKLLFFIVLNPCDVVNYILRHLLIKKSSIKVQCDCIQIQNVFTNRKVYS